MEVKTEKNEQQVTLHVSGTIDTETSATLNEALMALDYQNLSLTLDFKDVLYITSAGLRVLLVARKKLPDDGMKITNVNREIADIFEMTGFSSFLNYELSETFDKSCFDLSFKALLKKKAEEKPDHVVFVYNGRSYTWSDVDKASQIIASDLAALGVHKGSHVGLCGVNAINWVFAFFAVQKLGGIAVFVNYGLKPAEIKTLSHIGDITHLCCGIIPGMTDFESYSAAVKGEGSEITVTYDIGAVDFTARFGEYEAVKDRFTEMYHADDASIIIFTSGSTGLPKAVLSSSRNMLACIAPLIGDLQMNENDRNCAFLPFFHIFGFATAISCGILTDLTSYIPLKPSPAALIELIAENQCTLFHSVPTMALAMTQCPNFTPEKVSSLRSSILGGAATSEAQMLGLQKLFPHNHFGNIYGMSENAAVSITKYEDTVEHITKTIGRPVDGVEVEIRNPVTKEKVPDGVAGEIFIRSENMVVCYYKLDIRKQPVDDAGWLSTGDLGVIDPDGYLRLVGRVKELIIRNGENISPNEVAGAIVTLPEVADVKVIGLPSEKFGEEVAAALLLKEGAVFDEEKAREILSTKLAKFKIPSLFVVLNEFPLLGSGKVDTITLKKILLEKRDNP